jgi:hypothetical protein
MTRFRFRWELLGGHVHVRVFAGQENSSSFGKAGELVFREEEWADFRRLIGAKPGFDVVQDDMHAEVD